MGRADARFDVLVLGGGTAGCVLASRLSEDEGRRVCLVEAGPDYGARTEGRWPEDVLDARQGPESHDWSDGEGTLKVARVIGGCSSHNLCLWIRPAPQDWEEWAAASGDRGWSAEAVAPLIERVEEQMPLRAGGSSPADPWTEAMVAAAEELGMETGEDVNEIGEGVAPVPLNVAGTTRWNSAFAYLDQARGRPNLTICDRLLVDRVELDGGRALAAVVLDDRGRQQRIESVAIVLAAGAYGSPAILLRSGIGPEAELGGHGIPVASALPVGEALRDHFQVRFRLAPSEEMQRRLDDFEVTGDAFTVHSLLKGRSSICPAGVWDLHGVILAIPAARAGYGERSGHVLGLSSSLMRPDWAGEVRLRSRDPTALPRVSAYDLGSERDLTAIMDGLALCRRMAGSEAASWSWSEQLEPDPSLDGDGLRRHCAGSLASYFHPAATCPMGADGEGRSVVGPDGRVHGFENLFVADASVMPAIPRANTNLATMVVAERIAEAPALAGASGPISSG